MATSSCANALTKKSSRRSMLQTHTRTHTTTYVWIINGKPTCRFECEAARQDGWERSETDDTVFDVPSVLINDAPGSVKEREQLEKYKCRSEKSTCACFRVIEPPRKTSKNFEKRRETRAKNVDAPWKDASVVMA